MSTNDFKDTGTKLYSSFIHKSRYARWLEDEGRREDWLETVNRYIEFFASKYPELAEEIRPLGNAIYDTKIMPSMRCLMTAGKALERDHVAGFNCSYLPIDHPRAFDELMYILLCGTGVGFSVERQYVNKLPDVAEQMHTTDTVIIAADSKIGWAKAFKELVSLLYVGQVPSWDLSKVRPAGAKLKTFGGRASGPEPLDQLFWFTVSLFKKAAGRKLTSIECHDLCCKIAEVVVVGGVRRSALISLSNPSDDRMRAAKSGQWWQTEGQRSMANNSACYTEKPNFSTFLSELTALYESKSGERGFFSRTASTNVVKRNGRRDPGHEFGTNPCLHPDSMVETIHGRMKIKDIVEPTMVYSMGHDGRLVIRKCSASWISKKNAQTLNIRVASGKVVRCTPDHKIFIEGRGWIEAQDIRIGDKVVHLVRNRRGACYSGVKLTSQGNRDFVMEHRLVWSSYHGAIPDGYDIHHIDGDTYNNDIDNLECLSHADHASLTAFEQPNNHMVTGPNSSNPSGYGFISPPTSRHGAKRIVPIPEELKSNLHQYATVTSMELGDITDVYDLTVDDTHNFIADFVVVHNCSEIILRPNQFCNLSEVVVRSGDTLPELKAKVRSATILGTLQASLTDFRYLRPIWKKNTEDEALLGVSLTGIMDHHLLGGGDGADDKELQWWLTEMKHVAIETNKEWAEKLGINPSAALTCVKPSGTVSQLVNSASGIHPRFAAYYIRRVRSDRKDPLAQLMQDSGFPCEVDVTSNSNLVFSFPVKAPDNCKVTKDIGAIKQLELWKTYQDFWCEHKPSITVYYTDKEFLEVGSWLWNNFNEVSGISFLPQSEHTYRQAPYEEITEEQYHTLLNKMPVQIDWTRLAAIETEDNTIGSQELACAGGVCDIVDLIKAKKSET